MPYNSTIITKKKNLKCGHFDFNFSKGRCKQCATIENTKKRAELAKNEIQPQKQPRFQRTIQTPTEKEIMEINGVSDLNGGIWDWFVEQRKSMTGFCKNCGRPSCKNDDTKFHFSLAHILEKSHFPSIATHPLNVIELCFWGEGSCHTRMDNKMLDLTEMACWDEIVTKFVKMYPFIAPEERRRIPPILIEYLKTEI